MLDQFSALGAGERPVVRHSTRPWKVLHTCDSVELIRPLIEGELAIGMRPSVVTPDGVLISADAFRTAPTDGHHPTSLLNAWHEVRQWRKVILDADPALECDVLHAHLFSAGMAGVRNCPAVVYEINDFIEDHTAALPRSADPKVREQEMNLSANGSWLGRSFRVAEQFVISRAAAVVTRSNSLRDAAIRRGAVLENTFVIPEALGEFEPLPKPDMDWLHSLKVSSSDVLFFAPAYAISIDPRGALTARSLELLAAFELVMKECPAAKLFVEVNETAEQIFEQTCSKLGIGANVLRISSLDVDRAMDACDVVVARVRPSTAATPVANKMAEKALLKGKALLAADVPANRDVTPDGRGCLWFRDGEVKDLAFRAAFLARNADFRNALAASGRTMLMSERDPERIAEQYDKVYKHAAARRRSGGLQTPAVRLVPLESLY